MGLSQSQNGSHPGWSKVEHQKGSQSQGSSSVIRAHACVCFCVLLLQVLDDATDSVTSLQVSDHEILTGSADCKVRKYDIRNGQMMSDFVGSRSLLVSSVYRLKNIF